MMMMMTRAFRRISCACPRSIRFAKQNYTTPRLTRDSMEQDCQLGHLPLVREVLDICEVAEFHTPPSSEQPLPFFFAPFSSRHHLVATAAETTTRFVQRLLENLVCHPVTAGSLICFFLPSTTSRQKSPKLFQVNAVDTFNKITKMY